MSITSFNGEYYFLSNFYSAPVIYEGITYQNSEAAYQAAKTLDIDIRKQFATFNPSTAKKIGRKITLRNDWEKIKIDIMYKIVKNKFSQNIHLKKKLLDTGNAYLEEGNTWGDKIWGTVNGIGYNHLGKILMRVRDELR